MMHDVDTFALRISEHGHLKLRLTGSLSMLLLMRPGDFNGKNVKRSVKSSLVHQTVLMGSW